MAASTSWRPQPPSITDPPPSTMTDYPITVGGSRRMSGGDVGANGEHEDKPDWMRRAKDALEFSTTYIDSNYRRQWEDSLRAFNNQHSSASKYNTEVFRKRSNLYRPKTRAVIRKNEAASAAAFFSNLDRVNIEPQNPSDKDQRMSAEVMQELIQYRLTKSIPWFLIVQGGLQDAQVQGACVAHVHWQYIPGKAKDDQPTDAMVDQPVVELLPIENVRFDPSASWLDPVNTSPYFIHLIPMYVCDVRDRMRRPDPKGRVWKQVSDSELARSMDTPDDSTRSARLGQQQDPSQQRRTVSDYDIVWVHRHIHRWNGEDWEFYTLQSDHLLTEPEPLRMTVFHGKRPYVIGNAILETHKPMPASVPKLSEGLQDEANEVMNQRLDNIKFVLNKRWIVKRGRNVDLQSLVRNVPGGITLADDVENDVREVNWPDVTGSAYEEQNRIDADFSDLVGNFDPMQIQAMRSGNASNNTMRMLQGPSNLLTEYLLKTYVETFINPILRQLVLLEQSYETDPAVLNIAGQRAQLSQRFGVDAVTDDMLERELTVICNVGMGATDPVQKMNKFIVGLQAFQNVAMHPPPGINLGEVAKEIFGLAGYQDGQRFFDMSDPDKAHAQQMIEALQQEVKILSGRVKEKESVQPTKLKIAQENNLTRLALAEIKTESSNKQLLARHLAELERLREEHAMELEQMTHAASMDQQAGGGGDGEGESD